MPTRRRQRRHRLRWLGLLLLLALLAFVAYEAWTWPDVAALARRNPPTTAFIERYRARQRAAGRDDRVQRVFAPYGAIAPGVKRAILVAEDINFFSHRGFDVDEIRNAVSKALEEGDTPRGASTITQQLAKNLWLSPSRNPLRKLEEAILTWQLERTLPKRRIGALSQRRGVRPRRLRRRGSEPTILHEARRAADRRRGGPARRRPPLTRDVASGFVEARLPSPRGVDPPADGEGNLPHRSALTVTPLLGTVGPVLGLSNGAELR